MHSHADDEEEGGKAGQVDMSSYNDNSTCGGNRSDGIDQEKGPQRDRNRVSRLLSRHASGRFRQAHFCSGPAQPHPREVAFGEVKIPL
jgi:hypothetical protein